MKLYRACALTALATAIAPLFYLLYMEQDDPVTRRTWFWYGVAMSPIVPPFALFVWNTWRGKYPSRFEQTTMFLAFVWSQAVLYLRVMKF